MWPRSKSEQSPCRPPAPLGKGERGNGPQGAISANRNGLKVAVVVNDMIEINVDAQLMKNDSTSLSRVDERLVEMQNG
jgi:hypothetical protein